MYKIANTNKHRLEDVWLEITKHNKKYIVGGIYRHPNQRITDFKAMMEISLCKLTRQSHPSIIAGDMNIDLLQCDCQTAIHDYLNTVTSNNFVPSLVLPTRVTSKASTLIDHIYYYEGKSHNRLNRSPGVGI